MNLELLAPQSIESERAVLGSCILDTSAAKKAIDILKPNMFYVPSHEQIFNCIIQLVNHNSQVDFITLNDILTKKNISDDIGGYQYLIDLAESVPTTANVEQYANIIQEKYVRRQLIKSSNDIIKEAYENSIDKIENIVSKAEKSIIDINFNTNDDLVSAYDISIKRLERFSKIKDGELVPDEIIKSGYYTLDELFKLYTNDFVIVAARPGVGKSTFVLNYAINVCLENRKNKTNKPVLIFSLEMSQDEVIDNMIILLSEVNRYKLETGSTTDQEWDRVLNAVALIKETPIFVSSLSDISPNQIRSKARQMKSKYKQLGLIIIDYLQLMDSDKENSTGFENRQNEISKMSRTCKKTAMELNVPVIALSQLSRNLESRQNKRPQLSDLRESGSLEQDANSVVFIYRDELYNPDTSKSRIAEIIVAKQRKGPTGSIEMFFDSSISKFSSLEK